MKATVVADGGVDVQLPGTPSPNEAQPEAAGKRGRGRPLGSKTVRKDKPPVSGQTPTGPARVGRPKNSEKLTQQLTEQIGLLGMALMLAPSWEGAEYDGSIVLAGADDLARALVSVAESNASVRKILEALVNASAWGAVATAVVAVALPIAANHGLVPAWGARMIGGAHMDAAEQLFSTMHKDVPERVRTA